MRMLVLGAGLQGSACAYDLVSQTDVEEVRLADLRIESLPPFLLPFVGSRLRPVTVDARNTEAVRGVMDGCACVLSAVPYRLNAALAEAALAAGAHFADLGGNAEVVEEQRRLDGAARALGLSVVPDCGLAPGLVNIVAAQGIAQFDAVDEVRIYAGGLPQHPEPPLNYQVVYSLEGVIDYYTSSAWILRKGELARVDALSEVEAVDYPPPIGRLEAFHTSGGLSTMAERYAGRISTMEYRTLRYPGHARVIEAMRDLGFFDRAPIDVNGHSVVPRDVAIAVMERHLRRPQAPDLVVVRVVVRGTKDGRARTLAWELVDRMDEVRGISAMMRTTGYSLAVTGVMQARGVIPAGVHAAHECVPAGPYLEALAARGIVVRQAEG